MIRSFLASLGIAAAAFAFAAPAAAAPCDNSGMSSIEYALDLVFPNPLPVFNPGAACSTDSECGSTSEKCEGGSCCVKSGETCTGLGYCCGHPSQGCQGTCP